MIEGVGVHRTDKGQVVRTLTEFGEEFGEFHAALAAAVKLEVGGHDRCAGFDEGKFEVLGHLLGKGFAVILAEAGLRVEEFVLTGAAFHEHVNDVLGFGRKVRLADRWRLCVE